MRRIIPLSGPLQIFTSHSSTREGEKTISPHSNGCGGSVVMAVNDACRPILLVDGEELQGA
jgi:hypothetical protein